MKATIVIEDAPTDENPNMVNINVEFDQPVTTESEITPCSQLVAEFFELVSDAKE